MTAMRKSGDVGHSRPHGAGVFLAFLHYLTSRPFPKPDSNPVLDLIHRHLGSVIKVTLLFYEQGI